MMKPLSEQDHYEVLEVPRNASAEELGRAYQLASATYDDDSLAGYSIFEASDTAVVRDRIDLAWRVLSDDMSRSAYDASLDKPDSEPAYAAEPAAQASAHPPAPQLDAIEEFEEEAGDQYDGARLRRTRLRQGLEIDDVARQTKVNPTYLRFIEEERFADLPARVYVRGFVISYASCVGLDSGAVVSSYIERFDGARPQQRRWFSPPRGD